ncbi:hypothetical protein [Streptomyces sp. NPDC050546]|uniref:hypothetical protein n=1 Tax=Streptomyces sp. NPDC050546 TaxID=3365628 RepID=UPI0037AD52B1
MTAIDAASPEAAVPRVALAHLLDLLALHRAIGHTIHLRVLRVLRVLRGRQAAPPA